jgi:hypothetical protein
MSNRTSKILQWFLYALLIVSALLGIFFYSGSGEGDTLMYWGYALLIFAVVITIVASILNLIVNPKGSVKFLIMLAVMVVLAIVSYSLATNEFNQYQLEEMEITETTSKMVGAGLIFMYALAILAVLAIIYSSVSRIFK